MLVLVELFVSNVSFTFVGGNLDDTISLGRCVRLSLWSLVLESLSVVDVVEKSVGGAALEAVVLVFGR